LAVATIYDHVFLLTFLIKHYQVELLKATEYGVKIPEQSRLGKYKWQD
jgi:hypothetical protein